LHLAPWHLAAGTWHPGTGHLAAGSWQLAAGSWRLALVSWHLAAGTWQLAAGTWQLAAGSWQLAVGSWQLAPGSWHVAPGSWQLAAGTWQLAGTRCYCQLPGARRQVLRAGCQRGHEDSQTSAGACASKTAPASPKALRRSPDHIIQACGDGNVEPWQRRAPILEWLGGLLWRVQQSCNLGRPAPEAIGL